MCSTSKFQNATRRVSEDRTEIYERRLGPSPMKQRPMHTVMRRKPVPKADQPAKSETKVSTSESKVIKGPVKASDLNSTGSSRKAAETKKQEMEKPVPTPAPAPAPVEPPHGGHYELNARMTRMVENELRDIMIKVWHELPDNPTDEAECLVVDKLRNDAGDDLRNVLGLNITKRLLNVHNPLYVKVQFSGKPEKVHLGEFLKKYNFIAFKRIEKTVNMFAAQVKTITDFDRICSASDVRCGEIKVTVNPIYRFTKCPPNLITSFKNEDDASDEATEITVKEDKAEKIPTPEVVTKKIESVPSEPIVGASKTENADKLESQPKVESKSAESKTAAVNKSAAEKKVLINKPEDKTTPNKTSVENKSPADKKVAIIKPAADNKVVVNKPAVDNKNTANKTTVNKPAVEKPVPKPGVVNNTVINKPPVETPIVNKPVQNKTTVNKPAVENKNTMNKPAVENKNTMNKPAVENKNTINKPAVEYKRAVNKPSEEKTEVKKPQINVNNVKKPDPSPVKAQVKVKTVETNKPDSDYDELDDHDILALMSEGIILDECSGSEDE